ncbi:MAG: alpha-D-ribose 1-methylphosphonate 5-triphosphate diphosphatase [Betaproteobacteria bacterium]|nr:alpha-D-ribose 1-methylphosphonate 5-triphosphate diphosphatase [Betaproteobacteria bacterium]MBV9362101.1 alpha-D-ribose 1-methylphosphonate 5-triphosphate diphosphatase [Betaproteobacteria bacterium]
MKRLVLRNANIVLPNEVVRGSLQMHGRLIETVASGPTRATGVDLEGDLLIPGLIELHTDNFERHLMPRPKVRWPELPALFGHDAEIAAAGITTVYDALGLGDIGLDGLRNQDMSQVLSTIDQASEAGHLRAEHRLHVRCELPAPNLMELFGPFQDHPRVGLISVMDHTPGQRQWENLEHARTYYCGKKGWSQESFLQQLDRAKENQERYAIPHRRYFVGFAAERGVPLATHDDTLPAHVDEAKREGAAISEFPTRMEAARAARKEGLAIVMGAPNVVRGGSHSGNASALDFAKAGVLDVLSSDYVPASLMLAALKLVPDAGFSIPRAIATVSGNPARALKLHDRGEIAPGLRADLVQVRLVGHQPVVRAVWREGARVV